MGMLKRVLCIACLVASLSAARADATAYSTDQSDLWWIPSESGWVMQLIQQGSVIFATLLVYDADGTPTWYVATLQTLGNLLGQGDLYATTGPWFGTVPSTRPTSPRPRSAP